MAALRRSHSVHGRNRGKRRASIYGVFQYGRYVFCGRAHARCAREPYCSRAPGWARAGCGGTTAGGGIIVTNTVAGSPATIVIYDPSAGFVTGGGWINSLAGAYMPNPNLAGKATFGFVSKYQKGANVPTGHTEFQFQVGNLHFHSNTYQWLVVSGGLAQYKGTGTINGSGSYNFLLTARDGALYGTGTPDGFRIKITDQSGGVVYDNMRSASNDMISGNTETLGDNGVGGGSIIIHSAGK